MATPPAAPAGGSGAAAAAASAASKAPAATAAPIPPRASPAGSTSSSPAGSLVGGLSGSVPGKSPPNLAQLALYGGPATAPARVPTPITMQSYPSSSEKTKVLLLENVSQTAVDLFKRAGYEVECHAKALPEDVLIQKITDVHAIGIRSKTQLTATVLQAAKKLLTVGCFCIGTNQVALQYAQSRGVPVFNSPFSNSRSVAELTMAEIIALSRQLGERNNEMHEGLFRTGPVFNDCHEVRGRTLGIVGYGHIGSQLSVLAESMGMRVQFYDILPLMPLGTARAVATLEELLSTSDFVTVHVPETPATTNMIREEHINMMPPGSYLINNARGTVVDLAAVAKALKSGHLRGAAVDVYPSEPKGNGPGFQTVLAGCPNVIMTPHIGGSTEEAQRAIGVEVANAIIKYINVGSTVGSVNFPEVDLRTPDPKARTVRILNIHENVPGVLKQINKLLSSWSIVKQVCDSTDTIAYLSVDAVYKTEEDLQQLQASISALPESIVTRILY